MSYTKNLVTRKFAFFYPRLTNFIQTGFHDGWSEWSACFKRGDEMIRTRNQTCSVEGKCRHLAENIQRETCNDGNPF